MYILGIHIGHDSSAALLKNGQLLADVAEERFTRIKHYSGIPYSAVRYCLKTADIDTYNIGVIAV